MTNCAGRCWRSKFAHFACGFGLRACLLVWGAGRSVPLGFSFFVLSCGCSAAGFGASLGTGLYCWTGVVSLGFLPGPSPWVFLLRSLPRLLGCGFWRVFGDGPVLLDWGGRVVFWPDRRLWFFFFVLSRGSSAAGFGASLGTGLFFGTGVVALGFLPGPSPWVLLALPAVTLGFRPRGALPLCGAGWADEVAADSCRVPRRQAGGDRQVVVRVLASARTD